MPAYKSLARFAASSLHRWFRHDGSGQAAAVSFYALFAMAPLLVFVVVMASKALGPDAARQVAVDWFAETVPLSSAESIVSMVQVKLLSGGSWLSNLLSALIMMWASSLIFARFVKGTRLMFDQRPETPLAALRLTVAGRLIAVVFAVVVGLVFCLIFILAPIIAPLMKEWHIGAKVGIGAVNSLVLVIGGIVLLTVSTVGTLPKRAVFLTSLFFLAAFLVGKSLFQAYIQHSALASAYGVASSIVIFLVWVYYMSAGYFLGAAICAELCSSETQTEKK